MNHYLENPKGIGFQWIHWNKTKNLTERKKEKKRERYPEPSVCKSKRLKQHKAAFGYRLDVVGGGGGPQILRVLEWKESKATPKLHYVICVFKRQR